MAKFTVKFSALTDMLAYVEVEADTPEAAVDVAMEQVESADFDLPEDGAEPLADTWEAFEVQDDDGETVLELTQATHLEIANATALLAGLTALRDAVKQQPFASWPHAAVTAADELIAKVDGSTSRRSSGGVT